MIKSNLIAISMIVAVITGVGPLNAGEWFPGFRAKNRCGTGCPHCSPKRYVNPHHRAGHPTCVSKFAQPTDTGKYTGYYVGGGSAFKGEPRYCNQGTWGWDYRGHRWWPHRVWLRWTHGRRYQGGTGAYKTDGPHVPDVIAGYHAKKLNKK